MWRSIFFWFVLEKLNMEKTRWNSTEYYFVEIKKWPTKALDSVIWIDWLSINSIGPFLLVDSTSIMDLVISFQEPFESFVLSDVSFRRMVHGFNKSFPNYRYLRPRFETKSMDLFQLPAIEAIVTKSCNWKHFFLIILFFFFIFTWLNQINFLYRNRHCGSQIQTAENVWYAPRAWISTYIIHSIWVIRENRNLLLKYVKTKQMVEVSMRQIQPEMIVFINF